MELLAWDLVSTLLPTPVLPEFSSNEDRERAGVVTTPEEEPKPTALVTAPAAMPHSSPVWSPLGAGSPSPDYVQHLKNCSLDEKGAQTLLVVTEAFHQFTDILRPGLLEELQGSMLMKAHEFLKACMADIWGLTMTFKMTGVVQKIFAEMASGWA